MLSRSSPSWAFASQKRRQGGKIGIDFPNEDHGPVARFHAGWMRWRPANDPSVEMRNSLYGISESVCVARSGRNRDGNGPKQWMLWYRTTSTSGAAARVDFSSAGQSRATSSNVRPGWLRCIFTMCARNRPETSLSRANGGCSLSIANHDVKRGCNRVNG